MNSQKTKPQGREWMKGFYIASSPRVEEKTLKTDAEAVKRRRKTEETIEARRMLNEMGILL